LLWWVDPDSRRDVRRFGWLADAALGRVEECSIEGVLARSVVHLGEIVPRLEAKSVGLRILYLGLDTTTATGKLMLNVLGSVAQFEREMMLERQSDGIPKAKAQGKYKGRSPTAQANKAEVVAMLAEGKSKRDVARALGVSERSV
jgi:DNA invertase Pin-like site-specific DNA recombinase